MTAWTFSLQLFSDQSSPVGFCSLFTTHSSSFIVADFSLPFSLLVFHLSWHGLLGGGISFDPRLSMEKVLVIPPFE